MRIQSIDYLRGLMSLSIVIYHFSTSFTTWGMTDSGTVLGRLGIYAVTAFYIISGMALYLAHRKDEWSVTQYGVFILRRFLRLAPVYWVSLIVYTVFCFQYYNGFTINGWKYIQNIFLVFGLTNPTEYMIMGGWSIGNEVVFYLVFPFFIFMANNKALSVLLLSTSVFLLVFYAFYFLAPDIRLSKQWALYIYPINQIYYFSLGVLAAKWLLPVVGKRRNTMVFVALFLFVVFVYYPASGDQINIITGSEKIAFSILTIGLCSAFFLVGDLQHIKPLHLLLKFLGDISYPLYLLHGVSFLYYRKLIFTPEMNVQQLILSGLGLLCLLLILSWFCHMAIEKPIIKLSKRLSTRKAQGSLKTTA
ncbi:acyltransferase [Cronobacter universalis]|uniref:acyltransferase family protein n=1 Tax=Cronobacter universalis TaxID=535744 RepID=UPI0024AFC101|nr:acyltransferase [Cronobacter universalis]MDI7660200.1 acyltransferase [Cronobacter universalis]